MAYLTITDVESYMVDSAASGVEYKVIDFPLPACEPELCGRETPNFAMTDIVNPEQSVPFVRLVPPYT